MTLPREPRIHPVSIAALRPTQITVGMREVKAKRKSWRDHPDRKKADFLGKHLIPVIWGPKEDYYVIDHHHLALALHQEGVKNILTTVVADLRRLPRDAFWVFLDNRGWLHPFDQRGRRRRYHGFGGRSVSQFGRRGTPGRRLCQRHDAVQRIPVGGLSASPNQAQAPR